MVFSYAGRVHQTLQYILCTAPPPSATPGSRWNVALDVTWNRYKVVGIEEWTDRYERFRQLEKEALLARVGTWVRERPRNISTEVVSKRTICELT